MKKAILIFCVLSLYLIQSCQIHIGPQYTSSENQQLLDSLELLQQEIKRLSDSIQTHPTTPPAPQQPQQKPTEPKPQPELPEKKTPTPQPQKVTPPSPSKPAPPENQVVYHKYVNGSTSVMITAWQDSRRQVILYDLKGEETYRMEEVRMSYSESVSLKFHSNGAVSEAHIHSNPGASRYWYETTIKFSTTNDPLSMISRQMPVESLDQYMKEKWVYWDKKTKQWKEQEVIGCQELEHPLTR